MICGHTNNCVEVGVERGTETRATRVRWKSVGCAGLGGNKRVSLNRCKQVRARKQRNCEGGQAGGWASGQTGHADQRAFVPDPSRHIANTVVPSGRMPPPRSLLLLPRTRPPPYPTRMPHGPTAAAARVALCPHSRNASRRAAPDLRRRPSNPVDCASFALQRPAEEAPCGPSRPPNPAAGTGGEEGTGRGGGEDGGGGRGVHGVVQCVVPCVAQAGAAARGRGYRSAPYVHSEFQLSIPNG